MKNFKVLCLESGHKLCYNIYSDEYFVKYRLQKEYEKVDKYIFDTILGQTTSSCDLEDLDESEDIYHDPRSGKYICSGCGHKFDIQYKNYWTIYNKKSSSVKEIRKHTDKQVHGYILLSISETKIASSNGIARSSDQILVYSTRDHARKSMHSRKSNIFSRIYEVYVDKDNIAILPK